MVALATSKILVEGHDDTNEDGVQRGVDEEGRCRQRQVCSNPFSSVRFSFLSSPFLSGSGLENEGADGVG